jgi:sulfotransferase family protein
MLLALLAIEGTPQSCAKLDRSCRMNRPRREKQSSSRLPRAHTGRGLCTEVQDRINKPIFVVGSPRSGTSILTWCLGQHPNILMQEESNWIGPFAVNLAIVHEIGSARGEHSQLSALDIRRDEIMAHFGKSINDLILSHRRQFEINLRSTALRDSSQVHEGFQIARSQSDSKSRWVDGTPEYSLYICGLRKLFPGALFIHIVRDVDSVVRSLLNFDRLGEGSLVANEQQAYEYWLRTVNACLEAERAYGPQIVHRLQYSDLINNPESVLQSVLKFLGEPYVPACLEPLQLRINSSNVPASFHASDPQTDPSLVEQAMRLSTEVEKTPQPLEASPAASDAMEAAFNARVQFVATLASEYRRAQKENAERIDRKESRILRLKEEVKTKDLVILSLQKKLSRRPVEILKRILSGKSRR